MALLCLLTIMTGLLISLWIVYDAAPKWKAQYSTHYDNGAWASPILHSCTSLAFCRAFVNHGALGTAAASIVDLDLNPHRSHGICMPNPNQVSAAPERCACAPCRSLTCAANPLSSHPSSSPCASSVVAHPVIVQLTRAHLLRRGRLSRCGWREISSPSAATAAT